MTPAGAQREAETISPAEQADIRQALAALRPTWKLPDLSVTTFLSGGYGNRNYRISYDRADYVVRLPGTGTTTNFRQEQVALFELQSVFGALPATHPTQPQAQLAEVIAAVPQEGWLLTRWVDAPVLASLADVNGAQLGAYLAALHAGLQRAARTSGALSNAAPAAALVNAIVGDLAAVLPQTRTQDRIHQYLSQLVQNSSTARLSHIDLNPWNLLVSTMQKQPQWVTLDWETLGFAPPLFDLAVLSDGYAYNRNYTQPELRALSERALIAYNACTGMCHSSAELLGMRTLFRFREYAWAAARLAQGTLRSSVIDDVRQQRRDYAQLLHPQAAMLGIELISD